MSTLNQVINYRLKDQKKIINKISALCKNPQKKGICLNVFIKNPKKPREKEKNGAFPFPAPPPQARKRLLQSDSAAAGQGPAVLH